MSLKIIKTEDGSQSLYDQDLNETYHSTKGAKSESEYVFIKHGLEAIEKPVIRVLEVGFGTGLNAWLSWEWAERKNVKVDFYTLEPFPIPIELQTQMELNDDPQFNRIHETEWEKTTKLSDHFTLLKSTKGIESINLKSAFDVIFFDAFAPSKQPEIWKIGNLRNCFNSLESGGILTTYCAQGQFKRDMKEVGFELQVLPGALGKKEMVRGLRP